MWYEMSAMKSERTFDTIAKESKVENSRFDLRQSLNGEQYSIL
jgi:hypothetical protein